MFFSTMVYRKLVVSFYLGVQVAGCFILPWCKESWLFHSTLVYRKLVLSFYLTDRKLVVSYNLGVQ